MSMLMKDHIESQTYTTLYLVVTIIQQQMNLLLSTSLSEMEEIKVVLLEGLEIHNQITLLSEKPVMGTLHWRLRAGHTHSTIGTAMMMGKKCQPMHLSCTISTGEAI